MALNNPMPNIGLVEQLTEDEMKYYQNWLGRAFTSGQFGIRDRVFQDMDTLTGRTKGRQAPIKVYGYCRADQGSSNGWGESIGWTDTGKSPILDAVARLTNKGGLIGTLVGPVGGDSKGSQGGLFKMAETVVGEMGVSFNKVGASTQKSISTYSFSAPPSITFGWYMPKMHKQALVAIKSIIEMATLKSAGTFENGSMNYSSLASAMGQGLGNLGNTVSQSSINALNYTTLTNTTLNKSSSPMSADGAQGAYNAMMKSYPDFFKNAPKADVVKVLSGKTPSASMGEEDTRKAQAYLQFIQSTNQLGSGSSQAGGAAANATPIVIPETLVQGSYTSDEAAGRAAGAAQVSYESSNAPAQPASPDTEGFMSGLLNGSFNVAANFFGVDVTINPLPVRLKVGDMYHLEPLVIKEYTIKMSQELYYTDVSYSGSPQVAALPMHVTVDIKFDWWMLPSPMRNVNKVFGMPLYNYKEDGSDTATAANFPWLKQHGYFS